MKFKDLLKENFYKGMDVRGKYVEIFKNPSRSELEGLISKFKFLRFGATDKKKPDIYVWDGTVLHRDAEWFGSLPFKFGFYYERPMKKDSIRSDKSEESWNNWEKYKNKDSLIKAIKKMMPYIKYKSFWPEKGFKKL